MTDRGGGRHTYQAIAWEIREQIAQGVLRAGDPIPSLPALRRDRGISNPTAQAAVRLLKSWGLVEGRPDLGTFVREVRPVVHLMTEMTLPGQDGSRRTWREIVEESGRVGTQRVTGAGHAAAPVDVADAFGLDADALVAWRQRLLLVDDEVAQVCTSYYPDAVVAAVPELLVAERLPSSAMELMARAGFVIARGGLDTVFARAATEDEAAALGTDVGAPVTEAFRVARDEAATVVLVERMVSDGARLRQAWRF
ncbi:GntR family transcriptional regulator [Pseudofrankia inefficax]|uniref:Transcriptional regulator, GntR family n=1 Tax=Pseudofrankia inefficax (strain DSM 45817 / CECT 9037 / DDB 130130 / EuI1c) TaxID=298654 RepID=E3IVX3_PSEI1|nr:GntR family transcriptional regulator [Pseudofrankia inefficax]ADP84901.1 transcriptional regulator, GntR family [Pseudofrankia inefficax]